MELMIKVVQNQQAIDGLLRNWCWDNWVVSHLGEKCRFLPYPVGLNVKWIENSDMKVKP